MINSLIKKTKKINFKINSPKIPKSVKIIIFIGKNGTGKTIQLNSIEKLARKKGVHIININKLLSDLKDNSYLYKSNWSFPDYCDVIRIYQRLLSDFNFKLSGNGKTMWNNLIKGGKNILRLQLSNGERRIFDFVNVWFDNRTKNDLIIFDEPENHLHPKAQLDFLDFFIKAINSIWLKKRYIFNRSSVYEIKQKSVDHNEQIFISTHSPYIIKSLFEHPQTLLFQFTYTKNGYHVSKIEKNQFILSPTSINEINYFVFDISSIEYFNELYEMLSLKIAKKYRKNVTEVNQSMIENELNKISKSMKTKSITLPFKYNLRGHSKVDKYLITYVRNAIHHPGTRLEFDKYCNENILKEAIQKIIVAIKTI